MCLDNGKDSSDILNTSKQQLECSLSTVLVTSWAACQESESEYFGAWQVEGFVHEAEHFGAWQVEGFVHDSSLNQTGVFETRLGCLKHVLLEKPLSDTGEIIQAAFEVI